MTDCTDVSFAVQSIKLGTEDYIPKRWLEVQQMLLRAIQTKTYRSVDGNKDRTTDVRIITATTDLSDTKTVAMNFLNALERISQLVEQYREKNVEYECDIPILQETVDSTWKKEEELKALKAEVAALERRIQLTLAPSKPEAGQEQGDGQRTQLVSGQDDVLVTHGITPNTGLQTPQKGTLDHADTSSVILLFCHFIKMHLRPINHLLNNWHQSFSCFGQ